MSIERARRHLDQFGWGDRIIETQASSATVAEAAQAVGTEPARIAKTLSFRAPNGGALLIVAAGDARVNNAAFKATFRCKARMLTAQEAVEETGHAVGGVCPFGVNEGVHVYLDDSLKRFQKVYPACGSSNSAVPLEIGELEACSSALAWIDVCKNWE